MLTSLRLIFPSSRKARASFSTTLATARRPPRAADIQTSIPIMEPAPITARADAMKVATIRQKMSIVNKNLELLFLFVLDVDDLSVLVDGTWRLLNSGLSPANILSENACAVLDFSVDLML